MTNLNVWKNWQGLAFTMLLIVVPFVTALQSIILVPSAVIGILLTYGLFAFDRKEKKAFALLCLLGRFLVNVLNGWLAYRMLNAGMMALQNSISMFLGVFFDLMLLFFVFRKNNENKPVWLIIAISLAIILSIVAFALPMLIISPEFCYDAITILLSLTNGAVILFGVWASLDVANAKEKQVASQYSALDAYKAQLKEQSKKVNE